MLVSFAMEVEAGDGGVAGAVGVANGGVSTQSVGEGSSIEQEVGEDTVTKTPELPAGLKIGAGLLVEESAGLLKENGISDVKDSQTGNAATAAEEKETPHNVSVAQVAGETGHLVNNGKDRKTTKESDDEKVEEEEEDEDDSDQEEGMVEDDSEPLVESDEDSSDTSSDEEDESTKTAAQKQHKDGAKELEKMVRVEKEGSSEDEDGSAEPPRTVNEITVRLSTVFSYWF